MAQQFRLFVVENQQIVRYGICCLLEAQRDFLVVGSTATLVEAMAQTAALQPDLILVDIEELNQYDLLQLRAWLHQNPSLRILVLDGEANQEHAVATMDSGVAGFLLKSDKPAEPIDAIHTIQHGGFPLSQSVAKLLMRNLHHGEELRKLTLRERQILRLASLGYANPQIAKALAISHFTVRSHVGSILQKLDVQNRTQAALYFLREQGL